MNFDILIVLIGSLYLILLISFQNRYSFCLDKISKKEKHKNLLKLNTKVPLTGSFYFLPIILFLTYENNIHIFIFCTLFFFIGLLSDLKITTSPKLRLLLQSLILLLLVFVNKELKIDTRLDFLNYLMNFELFRIIIISFFFLVLINGFNFIDGVNNLSSLNIFIITLFLYLLSTKFTSEFNYLINIFLPLLLIFVLLNFFGKNFLGDGGIYGLGFFIGIISIQITLLNDQISPYFVANLLWYPAFENLFSILRRIFSNKKNYLADNLHLHQLLYKYLSKKKLFKDKYLTSSLTGILINFYLIMYYFIGFFDYSNTQLQIGLILLNTLIYLITHNFLKEQK